MIALRSRIHTAKLDTDPQLFEKFEKTGKNVIAQTLKSIAKLHQARRVLGLPVNLSPTTLSVAQYRGDRPFVEHLAILRTYDRIGAERVTPNNASPRPGSEDYTRRTIHWMTREPEPSRLSETCADRSAS